jgi:hypothetical protein
MGLHDAAVRHVDEMPAQHIGGEQHFPGPALEWLGAQLVGIEPDRAWFQVRDEVLADEDVLRSDPDLQACQRRVWALDQLDDEVLQAADLIA